MAVLLALGVEQSGAWGEIQAIFKPGFKIGPSLGLNGRIKRENSKEMRHG
jgi:hypothetical protein